MLRNGRQFGPFATLPRSRIYLESTCQREALHDVYRIRLYCEQGACGRLSNEDDPCLLPPPLFEAGLGRDMRIGNRAKLTASAGAGFAKACNGASSVWRAIRRPPYLLQGDKGTVIESRTLPEMCA